MTKEAPKKTTNAVERKQTMEDLQKAYDQLERSEQKFRSIAETAVSAIISADKNGKIVFWNHKAEKMFGYLAEEILGEPLTTIMAERYHKAHLKGFKRLVTTGKSRIKDSGVELFGLKKDGTEFPLELFLPQWKAEDDIFFTAIINDTTERKQVEEALHQYEHMVSSSTDMQAMLDTDFVYLAANPAYLRAFEKTHDEIVGHSAPEVFGEEFFDAVIRPHAAKCLAGQKIHYQDWFEFPALGRKYMDIAYSPYIESGTEIHGFVVTGRDITDRKRAEEALQESEGRFRDFFANIPIGFHIFGADQIITDINDVELDMIGYQRDEIVDKKTWADLIIPGQVAQFKKHWNDIITKGNVRNLEYTLVHKQGSRIDVLLNASSRFDEKGDFINTRGSVLNITERKKAQEQIKNLAKFPSENPNPVLRVAANGKLLYANSAAESLVTKWQCQVGQTFPGYWQNIIADAFKQGTEQRAEIEHEEKIFSFAIAPVIEAGYANLYGRDITERKQAEAEREHLIKALDLKSRELQDIVYTASHDLRSPLINIEGFGHELESDCARLQELLAGQIEAVDNKEQIELMLKEYIPESLDFIITCTKKMSSLLDGLLQVSRIGAVKINSESLDMNNTVAEVLKSLKYQIKENDITAAVDPLPDCIGDRNMLDHVFTNLVGNAIKYRDPAKKGKVHILGRVENNMSIYCVEDNGIGIELDHQKKVFEIFHRLRPDDATGGEGLGLTIVTRILDRLNGQTWLESEPDKGSKFFIALPKA